jgi:hypothetical protein
MNDSMARTPWHVWVVGVIALLFNGIGVFDYVMAMTQGEAYMAKSGMTPEQIAFYLQMPGWMVFVWTIGVWGALIGSILILLRRKPATPVFAVSLVAFVVYLLYIYLLTDGGRIMGSQMAIASAVIFMLLLLFTLYAWRMGRRGVLR